MISIEADWSESLMDLKLKGKRALVTGGSRGLGKAIARSLLAEGVNVVLAARNPDQLAEAVTKLELGTQAQVHGLAFDAKDDLSVQALIDGVQSLLGGLDIVINAAATPASAGAGVSLANIEPSDVLSDLDTKLLGYARVARAAVPLMAKAGWGRIINIAGLNARTTMNFAAAVRNVGVVALTKCLADELTHTGINVTAIHPGATRTERTGQRIAEYAQKQGLSVQAAEAAMYGHSLIGRIVEAEEIAAIATFLASPLSVAINGEVIAAGGGTPGHIHY
jgi:NAD(P)-dependent dehydrogenase (short-subunit alcohol dehydrogenase family)